VWRQVSLNTRLFEFFTYRIPDKAENCFQSKKGNSDMKMKYLIFVAMLPISTTVLAKKELPVNRYSCQNVEYKMGSIKERQRKGYSSKEAEKQEWVVHFFVVYGSISGGRRNMISKYPMNSMRTC
jgi:hypothetical protein